MQNISKNVSLIFMPLLVQAKYNQKIKFQFAIKRTQGGKIDKTEPMEANNPNKPIKLNHHHKLNLLTTLGYNSQTKSY